MTGAAIKSGCMLTHIQSCMEAMNHLQAKQDQLKDLEKELRQLDAIAKRFNTVKQQVPTQVYVKFTIQLHFLRLSLAATSKSLYCGFGHFRN